MSFTNRIIGFLLVAALSVLGGAQAGRAGAHDARAIEICAEDAVIIIHVDAEGRQVGSHLGELSHASLERALARLRGD